MTGRQRSWTGVRLGTRSVALSDLDINEDFIKKFPTSLEPSAKDDRNKCLKDSRGATTAALAKTRPVMLAVASLESLSERERQVYTLWFAGSLPKTIA